MPSRSGHRQPFQWLRNMAAGAFPGGGTAGNNYNDTLPPGAEGVIPGPAYPGGSLAGEPTVIVNAPTSPGEGFSSIPSPTPFVPPEWTMPSGGGNNAPSNNSYPNLYDAPPVMVDGSATGEDIPQPTPFVPPPWVMPSSGGVMGRGFTGPYGGGGRFGQGVGDFGIDPRGNWGQQSWSPGAYSQALLSLGIDPGAMMYRGHLQQ